MRDHNKVLRKIPLILFGGFIFPLLIACSQPTEFDSEVNLLTTESVAENLSLAYREKNLGRYMNSFSDQSIFFDGPRKLWDYDTEKQIHVSMFARATQIDLEMRALGEGNMTESSIQTTYRYRVNLQLANEPATTGEGEVVLEFIKNDGNSWQIASFRERKSALSKVTNHVLAPDDSIDYFPLRVGNLWAYEEQFAPNIPDIEVLVMDSLMIKGNLYYQFDKSFVFSRFVRLDSLHQLRFYFEDDSTDRIVFNLAAEVGDSVIFTAPNATEIMVVELISHKDSLVVPAGNFANVLEFLVTDFNSGSRNVYEFAANVGIIRSRGTNSVLALKSALVNGKKYPVITSVETSYASWTQIKSGFR